MKQTTSFFNDMLDMDAPDAAQDVIWRAGQPSDAQTDGADVLLTVPFYRVIPGKPLTGDVPPRDGQPTDRPVLHRLRVRAYGDEMVRITAAFAGDMPADDSVMLDLHESLSRSPLSVRRTGGGWDIIDAAGRVRMKVSTAPHKLTHWSDLVPPHQPALEAAISPDAVVEAPLNWTDRFAPFHYDSFPICYAARADQPHRAAAVLHADVGEHFAGTGERFARMDLAGKTVVLENTDGLGVNSRRTYKNVPFFVSSRPYGLLMLTTAHCRMSLADISTRSVMLGVQEPVLDLFFIGGGSIERVLYNYRRLTGFPGNVPLWSLGTWMSRMSYFSADETRQVAARMRQEKLPCDVLHIDTGWFEEDWKCTWKFGERFPEPRKFLSELKRDGYRVTLWQMPRMAPDNRLYADAAKRGYIAVEPALATASQFGGSGSVCYIDFSNPAAVEWYKGLLRELLEMGVSAIKTDFGEDINMNATYANMPPDKLHNVYGLLYQKAAYEVTRQVRGEGLVWARAGWTGCQRYPLHWGGDAACTWDGMAGSIRGGLHLGLSGFGFWSHDVPGFHGVPDFMNSRPVDDLYVRWTQFGVFTSHLRYHGTSAREPYEYPAVVDIVRKWLRLRYALIPYLLRQSEKVTRTGLPVLRALVLHHGDDPMCWHVDDQFYCGDSLLACPVCNPSGIRDVYLPPGEWIDLWTGEAIKGPVMLRGVRSPLERLPLYAPAGASVEVYPHQVQCTDEMDLSKSVVLKFDAGYKGFSASVLGQVSGL